MKEHRVVFYDESIKNAFEKLKNGKTEEKVLYPSLDKAFDDLKENPACGQHVPRAQIPREYVKKYGMTSLWKYNLPHAWRLIYTVKADTVVILAIVLEWMSHKEYERKFGYKNA